MLTDHAELLCELKIYHTPGAGYDSRYACLMDRYLSDVGMQIYSWVVVMERDRVAERSVSSE
ncbi:hypothetical protein BST95_05455 [Halioglobus japonicus]|uniref:Uncharacterized protein n=1 Tax=Halioglobus japonicus TaxID=930805 RepID=A0AAP8SN50_9GAMM|nr:hypothetical protein [Halioglobus japonicus]AQA17761.1 hypothetical protein BST95_05455 [Halioglobus japonicus]PLW85713.1 hypothetical protein C0029_14010 [Halioglobus japonicus]GHD17113.1 hypothetical protein GCM10007052_23260 [Halioglobus japonicus]